MAQRAFEHRSVFSLRFSLADRNSTALGNGMVMCLDRESNLVMDSLESSESTLIASNVSSFAVAPLHRVVGFVDQSGVLTVLDCVTRQTLFKREQTRLISLGHDFFIFTSHNSDDLHPTELAEPSL